MQFTHLHEIAALSFELLVNGVPLADCHVTCPRVELAPQQQRLPVELVIDYSAASNASTLASGEVWLVVRARTTHDLPWVGAGHELAFEQFCLRQAGTLAFAV